MSGGTGTTKSTGRYYLYENINAWTFSMAGTGRHSFDFVEQSDTKYMVNLVLKKSDAYGDAVLNLVRPVDLAPIRSFGS